MVIHGLEYVERMGVRVKIEDPDMGVLHCAGIPPCTKERPKADQRGDRSGAVEEEKVPGTECRSEGGPGVGRRRALLES